MTATLAPEAGIDAAAQKGTKKGSKKKLIIVLVVLLAAAGGGYWFFLKPSDGAPQPGAVTPLDSIQINLSGGHYLRLGLALQLTTKAEEVDGSKALDAAIDLFSGLPVGEVDRKATREKLRDRLDHTLEDRYDGDVMDVYFTEFVTQ